MFKLSYLYLNSVFCFGERAAERKKRITLILKLCRGLWLPRGYSFYIVHYFFEMFRLALFFLLCASSATAERNDFVFNETNAVNYSYPGNWSYVPCTMARFGETSCERMTGSKLTSCYYSSASELPGVCACDSEYGIRASLDTQGCGAFNATLPRCISGASACRKKMPKMYFGIFVFSANIVYLGYFILWKGIVLIFGIDGKGGDEFNVRFTLLLFTMLSSLCTLLWTVSELSYPLTTSNYLLKYVIPYALGTMSVGAIGALFTLIIVFRRCQHAIVDLDPDVRKNLKKREATFVLLIGSATCFMLAYFFVRGEIGIVSLIGAIYFLLFGLYFSIGIRPFLKILRDHAIVKEFRKHVERTAKILSIALFAWVLIGFLYGLRFMHSIETNTIYISAIRTVLLMTMITMTTLINYAFFSFLQKTSKRGTNSIHPEPIKKKGTVKSILSMSDTSNDSSRKNSVW